MGITEGWRMFYGVEAGPGEDKWHIVDETLQPGIYESLCGHSETASFPTRFSPTGSHPVCAMCMDKAIQNAEEHFQKRIEELGTLVYEGFRLMPTEGTYNSPIAIWKRNVKAKLIDLLHPLERVR